VFADRQQGQPLSTLSLLQLPGGTITPYAKIAKPIIAGDSGLAVMDGCKQVLVSQTDQSGSDIMMVETPPSR
jgi:hypothetical protein